MLFLPRARARQAMVALHGLLTPVRRAMPSLRRLRHLGAALPPRAAATAAAGAAAAAAAASSPATAGSTVRAEGAAAGAAPEALGALSAQRLAGKVCLVTGAASGIVRTPLDETLLACLTPCWPELA